ncbi:hypothetical protein [Rheinheimera sp.]|uniref:hypothetical protein n=1 Tax=Rheinheimera sp. TaxID=1869214 RepID=UPI00307F5CE1
MNTQMNEFHLKIYLSEISFQCQPALQANDGVMHFLKQLPNANRVDASQFLQNEVFRNLHSLLTHTSNVSRLLWHPNKKGKSKDRAEYLRSYLGLTEHHVVADRRLWDHLEHFDERLDNWREGSNATMFADATIGPQGKTFGGIEEKSIMRFFDPYSFIYVFRGEPFSIKEISKSVWELNQLIRSKIH